MSATTDSVPQRKAPSGDDRFDAFISYSHAADGALAPALQRGLQRFAKPWYRARAVRVFRDEASLAANPALWSSIERALDDSSFFILLASPSAAASPWVSREAAHWRVTKPIGNLLIALTEGELVWDEAADDFDWERTTALPKTLAGAFSEEPRYIDLRWSHDAEQLSLSDARFRDGVAELAAPLHGVPKDVIAGEEVRQHRRTVRIARVAGVSLLALTIASVLFGAFAVLQRNEARRQRDLALSRSLVQAAAAALDDKLDLAALLSLEAYRTRPSAETRSALVSAVIRSENVLGVLDADQPVDGMVAARDGSRLAVTGRDNVTVWILGHGIARRRSIPVAHGKAAAFSPDGRRLAVADPDSISIWRLDGKPMRTRRLQFAGALALAFGADTTLAAIGPTSVVQFEGDRSRPRTLSSHPSGVAAGAFTPDGRVAVVAGLRTLQIVDLDGSAVRRVPIPEAPRSVVVGKDGRRVITLSPRGDAITVWTFPSGAKRTRALRTSASALALSPDGRSIALGTEDGGIELRPLADAVPEVWLDGPLGDVRDIVFSGNAQLATVSEHGRVLRWDTRARTLVSARTRVGPVADIDVAQDAAVVVIGPSLGNVTTRWARADTRPRTALRTGAVTTIAVDAAGENVVAAGRGVVVIAADGARRTLRVADDSSLISSLAVSRDGIVAWGEPDRVVLQSIAVDGPARRELDVQGVPHSLSFDAEGSLLAVATDTGSGIWDVREGAPELSPVVAAPAGAVALSSSGRLVATGSDGRVSVWDTEREATAFSIDIEKTVRLSLAFSPDEGTLAVGTSAFGVGATAGELMLFETASGRELGSPLPVPGGPVADVEFSPTGDLLAVGATAGVVTLYDDILWADVSAMEGRLCTVAGRDLTGREWREFVGGAFRRTC